MTSVPHDLHEFMLSASREMAAEYERIRRRAAEDPGTAGDQGEENWATLLRNWLPPAFQIVTKGRILSESGIAGPQVDVLVLSPAYPKHLLDKKLYLSGGVVAAFECKITLTAAHLGQAVSNAIEIRQHAPLRLGTPRVEMCSPIMYGVLAHSHSWKGEASTPIDNIEKALNAAEVNCVRHPRESLDLVCVSDLGFWQTAYMLDASITLEGQVPLEAKPMPSTLRIRHTPDLQAETSAFTPIGSALSAILRRIAWEFPECRQLADYFSKVGLSGQGQGEHRLWPSSIYSAQTRERLRRGGWKNEGQWDDWNIMIQ